jgi:hypothetical protein
MSILGSLQYNKVEITPTNGGSALDLTSSIDFIDYFEDLLSPAVTALIRITANYSIFNLVPIRGGEKVEIDLDAASGKFKMTGNYALYVYKVSNLVTDAQKESFTLHLCSRETLTNETARVQKKYNKSPISDHVKSILNDVLLTNKYKDENIENTSNSYTFIGTQKKPFHILTWLCPKGIPATSGGSSGTSSGGGGSSRTGSGGKGLEEVNAKGVSGYLFYETIDGFNFRSIDSLVSKTKSQVGSTDNENIPKYTLSSVIQGGTVESAMTILNYTFEKNIDLIRSLRLGMYSNYTYFYNLYNDKYTGIKYSIANELNSKLGKNPIPYPQDFGNKATRVMVRLSDTGTLDPNKSTAESGRDDSDMAKSFARYNLLFTQSLNMMVPCNLNLKAGGIVNIQFPKINPSQQTIVDPDMETSGLYLIREVRHHFEGGQMVTALKLVRDSYGLY